MSARGRYGGGAGSSGSSSSSSSAGAASSTKVVDIYSSLPLQGAVTAQTGPLVNGIKLALSQAGGKAGAFTVNYTSLDDSTATSAATTATSTSPRQTPAGPRPTRRPSTTSASSTQAAARSTIPILNQAGVPQVSPANTYVGLTTNDPGSAPGEPQKYYPTGKRTYLRLVPRDSIQGVAGLIDDEAGRLHASRGGERQDRRTARVSRSQVQLHRASTG